ncbi:hypothetical protein EDD96_6209 [Streptomyces sp. Ag109_G2-6]|uniref:hypothetical protein n=1 Tax=Streptomyces TaxID=1883 RepID=UPI0009A55770|nr:MULTISPECIES: hypothetical protein [Streptomyces]RPF29674.1 hypothetical protein EDD96_6209 [Streptomyces sp. Ag109_G2-6]
MPDIRRGCAAVALLTALITTATACGGSEPEPVPTRDTAPTDTNTDVPTTPTVPRGEDLGKVFPGTDGDSNDNSTLAVPTTQLDEPAGGTVELSNDQQVPLTVQPLRATTDSGELSIVKDGCTGVTLQPQETCRVQVSHTTQEAGTWTGKVTAPTAEGPTFSVTLTGEAVAASTAPASESPTPAPAETSETPEETETSTPEPELS